MCWPGSHPEVTGAREGPGDSNVNHRNSSATERMKGLLKNKEKKRKLESSAHAGNIGGHFIPILFLLFPPGLRIIPG